MDGGESRGEVEKRGKKDLRKKRSAWRQQTRLKEVFSSRVVVRSLGPGGQLKPANGGNRRLWEA